MPDLQQLAVLAFALVPGFIASEVQSFVALRRRPPALETTLTAIAYSAALYLASWVGSWGPQFDPHFARLSADDGIGVALAEPTLLLRYLALIAAAIVLGYLTGRSLAWGWARSLLAALTGRNVIGSTWQEFFHDRPRTRLWIELKDGRRVVGEVTNASDSMDERVLVLAWPSILDTAGNPVPMGLDHLLLDSAECRLMGRLSGGPQAVSSTSALDRLRSFIGRR